MLESAGLPKLNVKVWEMPRAHYRVRVEQISHRVWEQTVLYRDPNGTMRAALPCPSWPDFVKSNTTNPSPPTVVGPFPFAYYQKRYPNVRQAQRAAHNLGRRPKSNNNNKNTNNSPSVVFVKRRYANHVRKLHAARQRADLPEGVEADDDEEEEERQNNNNCPPLVVYTEGSDNYGLMKLADARPDLLRVVHDPKNDVMDKVAD